MILWLFFFKESLYFEADVEIFIDKIICLEFTSK